MQVDGRFVFLKHPRDFGGKFRGEQRVWDVSRHGTSAAWPTDRLSCDADPGAWCTGTRAGSCTRTSRSIRLLCQNQASNHEKPHVRPADTAFPYRVTQKYSSEGNTQSRRYLRPNQGAPGLPAERCPTWHARGSVNNNR